MLRLTELDYELPERLIATRAAEPRDSARLLVIRRSDSSFIEHATVRDLTRFLRGGDLLVMNTTRVAPARLVGERVDTGGRVTGLYLNEVAVSVEQLVSGVRWHAILGGARLREGVTVRLLKCDGSSAGVMLHLERASADVSGAWVVRVESAAGGSSSDLLSRAGLTPLPPYILQARKHAALHVPDEEDRARYQTVFASGAAASVAAPTAGLHLTEALLHELGAMGVSRAEVELHVGTGTFKPVESEFVEQHDMHSERCGLSEQTRLDIARVRSGRTAGLGVGSGVGAGGGAGRVLCVGTTSARTVETFAAREARGEEGSGWCDSRLLITPGYTWRWTDGLLTNFHLPRSTLMAMVGALLPEGVARLREVYAEAIRREYRFYSFGDAMLVLP